MQERTDRPTDQLGLNGRGLGVVGAAVAQECAVREFGGITLRPRITSAFVHWTSVSEDDILGSHFTAVRILLRK